MCAIISVVQDLTLWFNLKAQGIKKKINKYNNNKAVDFAKWREYLLIFLFTSKRKKIILLSKKNIYEFYYQKSTKL